MIINNFEGFVFFWGGCPQKIEETSTAYPPACWWHCWCHRQPPPAFRGWLWHLLTALDFLSCQKNGQNLLPRKLCKSWTSWIHATKLQCKERNFNLQHFQFSNLPSLHFSLSASNYTNNHKHMISNVCFIMSVNTPADPNHSIPTFNSSASKPSKAHRLLFNFKFLALIFPSRKRRLDSAIFDFLGPGLYRLI